jgi:hypothetical protein
VNEKGKVIDVLGGVDEEKAQVVIEERRTNERNQMWMILYVDSAKPEPTKGLNSDFGLYINRPFYVVTELASHRHLDLIDKNMVIKTKNGRDS